MSGSPDEFNPLTFEKRLTALKDTQESIQQLSSWCLQKRQHHKKIVASWLNVLKRAKVEHRLTLFYLANDVIQYSKRKSYEFVESWGTTLQKATPLVRDDKVKHRILRIFRIWEERVVYDEEFLTDLTGLLSAAAGKQAPDLDPNDFQAMQLVNKIRQCSVLEADTDRQLKQIHESPLALNDTDALYASLKERRDVEEACLELDDGVAKLNGFIRALQKEIVARSTLCQLLQKAHVHYATQRGEVKVVANAYKNFGGRVRGLKRKLDELCEKLPPKEVSSPVPSLPDENEDVPSPGPDEDIDLPQGQDNPSLDSYNLDKTFSTSVLGDDMGGKGFSSFLGSSQFSFASFKNECAADAVKEDTGKKIEVINSCSTPAPRDDFNINDFLKSLIPNKLNSNSNENAPFHSTLSPPPPPPPILPGLDLIAATAPDHSLNINFYGSMISAMPNPAQVSPEPVIAAVPDPYMADNAQYNNWEIQRMNLPPHIVKETPESPTHETVSPLLPPPPVPLPPSSRSLPISHPVPVPVPMPHSFPPPHPHSPLVIPHNMIHSSAKDVDQRPPPLLAPPPPPIMPQAMMEMEDVDQRMLPPLPQQSPLQHQNDRNRQVHKVDVDHRNLISLTGSLPPLPNLPISPWTPKSQQNLDQDYRSMGGEMGIPVPPPLPHLGGRRIPSHNDNVESIDMEMSDEEMHEMDDEYSRHSRVESAMSKLHANPPPNMCRHSQPPPHYRKAHVNSREKSFINNNNKLLVGNDDSLCPNKTNNIPVNSSPSPVKNNNLVRINSATDIEQIQKRNEVDAEIKPITTPPVNEDVFDDPHGNMINPSNPNVLPPAKDTFHSTIVGNEGDDNNISSEPDSWSEQADAMNPAPPDFGFHRAPPPSLSAFRGPPPSLYSRPPPLVDERFFSSVRGPDPGFRRPWRPPQRPSRFW